MSLFTYVLPLVICLIAGTKSVACIRQYCVEENEEYIARPKVIDLVFALIVGMIPFINFIAAVLSIIVTLIFVFMECIKFRKGFFNKNLFGGNDD